jgi:D-beta-D-heptose 7-phosphate kinase/D-beta-D-heptose 1-phosphate adenosyltransferase
MKIWVNGCFDILHHGHLQMLRYAGRLGDRLVVGIDSDSRVKELKGRDRPYHNETQRKFNLKQLKYVDKVIIYESEEMLEWNIRNEEPDVMVIGSDYKNKKIIGVDYIRKIHYFDRIENMSTTDILNHGNIYTEKSR